VKPGENNPDGGPLGRTLDLGCGRAPRPGAIGVDSVALPLVRVVARLDARRLPFRDNTACTVYALNVLEHLPDVPAALAEIWRVLAGGGRCVIEVPYFSSVSAYADPTHVAFFTYTTFEHFCEPPETGWQSNRHAWFGQARFSIDRRRLRFGRAHRFLGIQALANRWPAVYENLFAYLFPARALEVELRRSAAA
jgi:SAM-dependent methyltransferase